MPHPVFYLSDKIHVTFLFFFLPANIVIIRGVSTGECGGRTIAKVNNCCRSFFSSTAIKTQYSINIKA